ncbi:uncharacterized protein [Mytilus edulis]|uniref:Uncharacterized protein n=1 Tax=Mytilus edulis TaxID=6550 RepID=A0A8S3TVD7_MYTED|nr:unnamed protein product [Mytilus edulis]
MQIKDTCTLLLTFIIVLVCQVSSKDLFSSDQGEDSGRIDDLDIIADGRSKRTNYRTLNDIESQNSLLSVPYKGRTSLFPRQLRQSPYFALRGKRIPKGEYISSGDSDLFNEESIGDIPSSSLQSRDKRMISLLTLPDPRYESLIRRVIGQSMKMSNAKARDLMMDKRQHYRFHALRG